MNKAAAGLLSLTLIAFAISIPALAGGGNEGGACASTGIVESPAIVSTRVNLLNVPSRNLIEVSFELSQSG